MKPAHLTSFILFNKTIPTFTYVIAYISGVLIFIAEKYSNV